MNFMNALEKENNKRMTLTENGALAYETSGKELLDFLFATTAMRKADEETIKRGITKVYFENPLIANKFFFWLRDCRGGNGERRIFRVYLKWLAENKRKVAEAINYLVPEYGRYDDLLCLLDTALCDDVCALLHKQLEADIENSMDEKPVSLLAKWLPSSSTSSKQTRHYAEILRKYMGVTPRQYRKTIARLREYLNVVEVKASANRWNEIDYEAVPSLANVKYSNAFMKHDEERRIAYLNSLKNGESKINASVLQPHEIVTKYIGSNGWYGIKVNEYDEALEQLWKALPVKSIDNCLVVRDGSGSMMSGYNSGKVRPLDVATALAVYMADHNHGIWKDKFITFSANPNIIDLGNCETLRDKLIKTYDEDDCSNTDIERTMMLILNTAVANHCSQEDMPASVLIISDMQFDSSVQHRYGYNHDNTLQILFEDIADRYEAAGYKLPKMIFWNVAGQINKTIPMQKNELGVILISGFSVQLLNMVMSGQTDPYKAILDIINSERYQPIENILREII